MTQKLLTLPFRIGFGAARTALDISAKTLDISAKLAGSAIDTFWPGSSSEPDRPPATGGSPTAPTAPTATTASGTAAPTQRPTRRPAHRESRVNGHGAETTSAPPSPPPATTEAAQPEAPHPESTQPEATHPEPTQPEAAQPEPTQREPTQPDAEPFTPPEQQPDTPLTAQQDALKTMADDEEVVAEFAEPGAEEGAGAQLDVDEPWQGYAEMNAGAIISRIDQAGPAELALLELYEQTHKKRQTVLSAASKRLRALSPPEAG